MSEVDVASPRAQIERTIREAFEDVPWPRGEPMTLPPSDARTESLEKIFAGRHWRDMTPDTLKNQQVYLFLFSPAWRRFYLPAYLLQEVDRIAEERSSWHTVVHALCPPEEKGWFEREYDVYAPVERRAIVGFLEYARDNNQDHETTLTYLCQTALATYWQRESASSNRPSTQPETTSKVRVRQAVEQAFADVPYPGDEGIGYNLYDWDGAAINRDFKGYHWRALPRDVLLYHHDDLPMLSKHGRQFYLPAYIREALEGSTEFIDDVVWTTGLSDQDVRMRDWVLDRNEVLSTTQKNAIRMFLEYVRDDLPDEEVLEPYCCIALDYYWTKGSWEPPAPIHDEARKDSLKRIIREAFAGEPYPGDECVVLTNAYTEADRLAARDFCGHTVEAVPREVLLRHQDAFTGFCSTAMRYYLPAFMSAAVDEVGEIIYRLLAELRPFEPVERFTGTQIRYDPLTLPQKQAVARFLEYVRDQMPHRSLAGMAQKALDRYWTRAAES